MLLQMQAYSRLLKAKLVKNGPAMIRPADVVTHTAFFQSIWVWQILLSSNFLGLISQTYFTKREQLVCRVPINGEWSGKVTMKYGVPQGSVGPTLTFNLLCFISNRPNGLPMQYVQSSDSQTVRREVIPRQPRDAIAVLYHNKIECTKSCFDNIVQISQAEKNTE